MIKKIMDNELAIICGMCLILGGVFILYVVALISGVIENERIKDQCFRDPDCRAEEFGDQIFYIKNDKILLKVPIRG